MIPLLLRLRRNPTILNIQFFFHSTITMADALCGQVSEVAWVLLRKGTHTQIPLVPQEQLTFHNRVHNSYSMTLEVTRRCEKEMPKTSSWISLASDSFKENKTKQLYETTDMCPYATVMGRLLDCASSL